MERTRLPRRWSKLRAMSVPELAHRVRYQMVLLAERGQHRHASARPDRLRARLVDRCARRADWEDALLEERRAGASRFFPGTQERTALQQRFAREFEAEGARIAEEAAKVRRHEIDFFGETFTYGPTIDWHRDPRSDRQWPRRFHSTIPTVGDVGYGDIKYVWELNRHQFLVDLARDGFVHDAEESSAELQRLVLDWIAENPYGSGVSWACALEPAFRAWSWLWAYHLCLAAGHLDRETHVQWLLAFHDHGRFLYRHAEVASSPYNHLAGEAAALYALGLLFPEFEDAARWRRRGRRLLESRVSEQFHPDGGSVEQSTFYHHATLGFYMLAALLARRSGTELSPAVWQAIERGIEFSMALMQPNGRTPTIGGADDGKPIRLEHAPLWDFRPYLAMGAVLFGRPDFKFAAGRFREDALWMLGTDGADAFEQLPSSPPATAAILPASGYLAVRSDWSRDADYLCFDCGPQAGGLRRDHVPSAAHGHADCLSVILGFGGRDVLVDPGFFCYNGEREWEIGFRRTAAHNTLTIDDRDQARHVSKMVWTHTYDARFEAWPSEGPVVWAQGSHDGYARDEERVVHRRSVWLRPDGYAILYDELTGGGAHRVRANFQFAPGCLALQSDDSALFDDRYEIAWACSAQTTPSLASGGPSPFDGWIAQSLGVRVAAPHLTLEFPFAGGRAALLTVVADRRGSRARRVRVATAARAADVLTARVALPEGADRILATAGRLVAEGPYETDATVAVIRESRDGRVEMSRIGGTCLRCGVRRAEGGAREAEGGVGDGGSDLPRARVATVAD